MSLDVVTQRTGRRPRLDLSAASDAAKVAVDDGTLPSVVFGVSDALGVVGTVAVDGPDTRVDEDSIFFLASVTKPIVATAVMRYVDEGRVDLRAPLARYLPEFDGPARERVTAWHILTHTSGLPDMPVEELFSRRPAFDEALRVELGSTPTFEPGSRFSYASSPFLLLAEVMARASGVSFSQVLQMRVTGPLGMHDTTFDPRYDRRRAVSLKGLEINNRVVEEVMVRFLARATLPGGGMFATVGDLLRLGRALLPAPNDGSGDSAASPRILSAEAIAEMSRLQTEGLEETLEDGTTQLARFGLGWAKPSEQMPGTGTAFTHGGAAGGRLWIDPDAGLAYAFLTNQWGAPSETAYAVLEEIYRAWD